MRSFHFAFIGLLSTEAKKVACTFTTGVVALFVAAMALTAPVRASTLGTPPPGAIFDLAATSPYNTGATLSTQTQFTTTFVGDGNMEYVSFAFREVPAYFAFDNASVTTPASGNLNLLQDGDFEQSGGTLGTSFPVDWNRWIQIGDTSAIGVVANNTSPYGCGSELNGSIFWCDGSVQGYDGLYQEIQTTANALYTVTWSLDDNSHRNIYNPGIDMLVYAGDSLPDGTRSAAPEPATMALLGSGLLGLALVGRRRRNRGR